MPEILPDHVPSPRTMLVWDGTAYRAVRGHTDGTVQVRGEDQLFSYSGALHVIRIADISGAGGHIDSTPCPAGTIWVVTGICVADTDSPTTAVTMEIRSGGTNYAFHYEALALAAWTWYPLQTEKYLDPTDIIRITFTGSIANDSCRVVLTGYTMTLET